MKYVNNSLYHIYDFIMIHLYKTNIIEYKNWLLNYFIELNNLLLKIKNYAFLDPS